MRTSEPAVSRSGLAQCPDRGSHILFTRGGTNLDDASCPKFISPGHAGAGSRHRSWLISCLLSPRFPARKDVSSVNVSWLGQRKNSSSTHLLSAFFADIAGFSIHACCNPVFFALKIEEFWQDDRRQTISELSSFIPELNVTPELFPAFRILSP